MFLEGDVSTARGLERLRRGGEEKRGGREGAGMWERRVDAYEVLVLHQRPSLLLSSIFLCLYDELLLTLSYLSFYPPILPLSLSLQLSDFRLFQFLSIFNSLALFLSPRFQPRPRMFESLILL